MQCNIKIFHRKFYKHTICQAQPQPGDSRSMVFVGTGGSAFIVYRIPHYGQSPQTSNSRAHPREEGTRMALTGPGSPTMVWVSPSHFIPEETEAQRNAQLSPQLADRVGRSAHIPGRQHQAEFREVRPVTRRRTQDDLGRLRCSSGALGTRLSGQGAEFIWSLWAPPRQAPRALHSKLSDLWELSKPLLKGPAGPRIP